MLVVLLCRETIPSSKFSGTVPNLSKTIPKLLCLLCRKTMK